MKKLIVGALLVGTLGLAACSVPEEEPVDSAKVAKARRRASVSTRRPSSRPSRPDGRPEERSGKCQVLP